MSEAPLYRGTSLIRKRTLLYTVQGLLEIKDTHRP